MHQVAKMVWFEELVKSRLSFCDKIIAFVIEESNGKYKIENWSLLKAEERSEEKVVEGNIWLIQIWLLVNWYKIRK